MTHAKHLKPLWLIAASCAALAGCDKASESSVPGRVSIIADGADHGFTTALDAVVSPDGTTFYFSAYTNEATPRAAIYRVGAQGEDLTQLAVGGSLYNPTGLVLSNDGATLYIADQGESPMEAADGADDDVADSDDPLASGRIYTMSTSGGDLTTLTADGIQIPSGLAMSYEGDILYATGWTADAEPAVFTLPASGGAASVLYQGAPLKSVTGIYVDPANVAWVMDHLATGSEEEEQGDESGTLMSIDSEGTLAVVVRGLELGTPGGVSLTSDRGTAVMAGLDESGRGAFFAISLASGKTETVAIPEIEDPAGLRSARNAQVFAVVDSDNARIFKATPREAKRSWWQF